VREQFIRQVILNAIARTISQNLEMSDLFAAITLQLQQMAFVGRASITLREGTRPHARILFKKQGSKPSRRRAAGGNCFFAGDSAKPTLSSVPI